MRPVGHGRYGDGVSIASLQLDLDLFSGPFDLLLTDIQMPIMDGIALALASARDFPELTILLMTGFADQRERASGLNAIAHDVISKPFSVADIRTAVADALASKKV